MEELKKKSIYFFQIEIIHQLHNGVKQSFNYERILDVNLEIKNGNYCIDVKQDKYDVKFPEDCRTQEGFIWELMNMYKHIQLLIKDSEHIEVMNFEHVQENWFNVKKEILSYFEGDYIINYMELAEEIIMDKKKMLNELFLDRALGLILPRFLIKSTNHITPPIERIVEYPNGNAITIIPDVQVEHNELVHEISLSMHKNNNDNHLLKWDDYESEIVICSKTKMIKTHLVNYKVQEGENIYLYNYRLKQLNDGIA